jgi:lysine 2,3-aminomutase
MTSSTLRRPHELVEAGIAQPHRLPDLERVAERYAVSITPAMAELIDPCDPDDPIARQFVPNAAELDRAAIERDDPIGDDTHSPVPGLVHRYPDRVLLKYVSVCAVYCRFCFRRETVGPGDATMLSAAELDAALGYVAARPDVWEVIVSGGDPLIASPRRLANLSRRLGAVDHVKVVRWHSRVPVVAPERIDDDLVAALKAPGKATYLVVHANHPRELTPDARSALAKLADAGIALLGQSVLLKGVNDDAAVLGSLMRALVESRVKPYYLHQGDLAPGTSHLRTSVADGQELMRGLRGAYSGLCQPTYVLDIPGGYGKVPVGPCYVTKTSDGMLIEDAHGERHAYPLISDEVSSRPSEREPGTIP